MHYNLVKATNRRYLEELNNTAHEMPLVYDSVNIMQQTEWVINKPIFDVIKTCMDNDFSLGKLPIRITDENLPPKPHDIQTNKEALINGKEKHKQYIEQWVNQCLSGYRLNK